MPAALSLTQLAAQQVELLPARTVLSMVWPRIPIGNASSSGNDSGSGSGSGVVYYTLSVLGLTGNGAAGADAVGSDGAPKG